MLGGVENGMLWSSLGFSLLVVVAGAFLVPGLSLPDALLAILVGGIFGNALLGCAAGIGAEAGVPAMVLLRAPLGRAGSYLPTGLNVVQNVGWTIFEVLVIATAAQAPRSTGRSGSGSSLLGAPRRSSRSSGRSGSCASRCASRSGSFSPRSRT